VIGGCDRNYIVIGTAPVYATNWSDVHPDKTGWKVFDHSYRGGSGFPMCAGWQWSGFFGFKFNIKKSALQIW